MLNIVVLSLQVDQLFSILCRVLKSEINCPDELIKKMKEAPIIPKAEVEEMWFIWDWRSYITPKLCEKSLVNHSFYHSFQLKKEGDAVALRAKKYTQMSEWVPEVGIKLLKDGFESSPVPAAELRIETLNLEKVMSDLYTKFFPTLETEDRKVAVASWEKLVTTLQNLPKRRHNLPPLKLSSLPRQKPVTQAVAPDYLEPLLIEDLPDLGGEHCILEPIDGKFEIEIRPEMDVAVYTHSVKDRPWLGRVISILETESDFEVHWFQKKSRTLTFSAMFNSDGSRLTSVLPLESVMMWEFSTNKQVDSFDVSKDWYAKILSDYESHDKCYQ